MPHKADNSFFDRKRDWSKRKDRILGSYVTAYLPKVATLDRPILIVDGFAGPGAFGDGESGSPKILQQIIDQALGRGLRVPVKLLCVERDLDLYSRLQRSIANVSYATAVHGNFSEHVETIARLTRTHTTFMYIDPFTVEGLVWSDLDQVFQQIERSRSVEILLNFNASSFVRRGLAALSREVPAPDPELEDVEEMDAAIEDTPSADRLTAVLGTDRWREVLSADTAFVDKVYAIEGLVRERLATRFAEVCDHAMIARPTHRVPKYFLAFASRHRDALRLMNDEVVKSRQTLAEMESPVDKFLFEMRSTELVPETADLPRRIRDALTGRMRRRDLIIDVIRDSFGEFSSSEIRGTIERMIKSGEIHSETGSSRINDKVMVWCAERHRER